MQHSEELELSEVELVEDCETEEVLLESNELDELSDQRKLIVVDKESATPMKYPRRPGIPSKRPLA